MNPQFFQVGGSVRDILLGITPKDIDYVVVGATPEWMLANGYTQVGADFPVFLNADGVEYALARKEKKNGLGYTGFETDFNPSISLKEDLYRRDLTVNAMAFGPTGELIDPFSGQNDMKGRIFRHVSEAFAEDPVRVLRLARFMARYDNWSVAHETNLFCREMVKNGELEHLTKERVWTETVKALGEANPSKFFFFLDGIGALKVVFPALVKDNRRILSSGFNRKMFPQSDSIFYRFSTLVVQMTVKEINEFCDEYRVPSDFRDHAVMYRQIQELSIALDPEATVMALENLKAYKSSSMFEEILFNWHAPTPTIAKFAHAYAVTAEVGFKDLTEGQQSILKGREIGDAIRELRVQRIKGP